MEFCLGRSESDTCWTGRKSGKQHQVTYLPTVEPLVPVVCIIIHDEVVDAVEIEFPVRRVHYRLRNHLRIAKLGFDMPILIPRQVDL